MYKNIKILAIVPARKGSKGLPNKNILKINGKSLIKLAADFTKKIQIIDFGIISTDSRRYGLEAQRNKLNFLFKRPKELARSFVSAEDVWRHAWKETEKITKQNFEISIYLEPTSPIRKASIVTKFIKNFIKSNSIVGFTVSTVPLNFSAFRQFVINKKIAQSVANQKKIPSFRQKIRSTYLKNGICYVAKKDFLCTKKRIISMKPYVEVIDHSFINIDSYKDMIQARKMLS